MRARYTDGTHADSPWSGAWAEATLLVAAPVAAQAQQYDGAISGLTLTSDAPGDLDLSWDAPGTAPTDYWVSWARSGEDWPAETDAAANRYPTTTSLELTGLDEGTEYQVRVRARYTDGTHADSPWSGAWAEATLLVAATVAAQAQQYDGAISGLTLTSDAPGDLDLSWDAPGTAPTDYWVSWARSGEDWPAETDAAANRYPTTTSLELTGLDEGTEYQVRVRARYTDGTHADSPWSGAWAEATLLVAATVAAQAQQYDGAISGLTLTSDAPGVLDLSWNAPGTAPTDYWVSWARSDEDWPAETDAAANRYPTTTSLELTGLDEGTEYQVRVRARYTDGAHADSPWSGPWAEATLQTAAEPSTVFRSDDELPITLEPPKLTVFDPDDPPVALQQNATEKLGGNESIGSDSAVGLGFFPAEEGGLGTDAAGYFGYATSFTPDAGAGWYALSSISAFVNPEELGRGLIRVSIHDDNSDSPATDARYVAYVEIPASSSYDDIRVTAQFPDYTLLEPGRKYWAVFDELSGTGRYLLQVSGGSNPDVANQDAGFESWEIGDTGREIDYLTATGFTWLPTTDGPILMTFHGHAVIERVLVGAHGLRVTAADGPLLRFGAERVTKFWLRLPKGSTFDGGATNPDVTILCDPTFVAGSSSETSLRLCDLPSSKHFDQVWAGGRGFTTGANPTGYTITALGADLNGTSGTVNPAAQIYPLEAFFPDPDPDSLDPPGTALASYRAAGTGNSPDRFASTTGRLQVSPQQTYVAYFSNDVMTGGGYFEMPNAAAGVDPGGAPGWSLSIADYGDRFSHPWLFGGLSWNVGARAYKRIPLNVYGWPNPPEALSAAVARPDPPAPAAALVSNLGKASIIGGLGIVRNTSRDTARALSFTTGGHAAGYAIHGVQIQLARVAGFVGALRAAIHADDGGVPGASLHQMGLQTDPRPGLLTFHAPASTTLAARTTYWLVIDAANTATADRIVQLALTRIAGDDDCAARDWSLGSVGRARVRVVPADETQTWPSGDTRLKMAILGERVSDTSVESGEPTCGDLPAGASTTGRLIVDEAGVSGEAYGETDVDWYGVELEAATDYQFDAEPGHGLSELKIYTATGAFLQSSEPPSEESPRWFRHPDQINSLTYLTVGAGVYYVSIESWGLVLPGSVYRLSARSDDHPKDASTTAEVEVGESTRVYIMRTGTDAHSTSTNDVDWIKVNLNANVRYRFEFDVGAKSDGMITGVYRSDGSLVPNSEAVTLRQAIHRRVPTNLTLTAPADDDYYVAVSARGRRVNEDTTLPFEGAHGTLTVTLIDDDVPTTVAVTVQFGAAAYTATEDGTAATVAVTLSADPERTVTVPLSVTVGGTAMADDYTLSQMSVTFNSGEMSATFTVTAEDDSEDDDGESITIGFGTLPAGVSAGSTASTTVSLVDDDVARPSRCSSARRRTRRPRAARRRPWRSRCRRIPSAP